VPIVCLSLDRAQPALSLHNVHFASYADVVRSSTGKLLVKYQTPLPVTAVSPATIYELLNHPSRARNLIIDSIPELLARIAGRVAALKTLEGTLLAMMLSHRVATSNGKNVMSAPQVAKLFDVPESWSESRLD
jgi:hypothetical protein